MKNDIVLLDHLKVLQQKLSSTKVPNRSKSINETSATSNSIFGGSSVKIPADGAHKGQSGWQSNNAWDIPTPIGTPIYAVADGTLETFNDYGPTVIKTNGKKLFGQGFTVKSDNGLPDVYYTHLKDSVVKKGDKVKCGQLLGYVMDFPNSSYDHLHIGIKTGHDIKEFLNTDGTLKCGGTISGKVSEPIQSTSGDNDNSDDELEDESNDDVTTTTTTKKGNFLDFFKDFGGILKEELIIQEHLKVLQQKLSSTDIPNRPKYLNESSLQITDISGESKFKYKSLDSKYFVIHHTAGRGTASGVVKILNCRHYKGSSKCTTLGIQWIIDRDGKLYQALPKGSKGAHIAHQKSGMGHINNSSAEGVEIIGSNDDDITDKQCKTALILIKNLGYSLSNVFGHGEVSTNKQATEGQRCKRYATKYWSTPEDELPDDGETGKDTDPNVKDNEIFKPEKDNSEYNDNKSDEVDVKDDVTTTTTTEKGNFLDFFKDFGGILKNKEDLKIEEDVQRIKNLLK